MSHINHDILSAVCITCNCCMSNHPCVMRGIIEEDWGRVHFAEHEAPSGLKTLVTAHK